MKFAFNPFTGNLDYVGTPPTVSATAPANPQDNDLWWDSASGILFIYYNDGSSSQWVAANSGSVDFLPAGSTTQVQFNDAGALAGNAGLTFDKATGTLRIGGADNYMTINGSGKTTFAGTAKVTHHEQISVAAAITSGVSTTTYGIAGGLLANANSDFFYFTTEVYGSWDGSDAYIEVDWCPRTDITNGQTVIWKWEWKSLAEGEDQDSGSSATDTTTFTSTGTTSAGTMIHSRVTIPASTGNQPLAKQDHLFLKLYRDATADGFSGDVMITAFEYIWTADSHSEA
jgi:hypothetical protein